MLFNNEFCLNFYYCLLQYYRLLISWGFIKKKIYIYIYLQCKNCKGLIQWIKSIFRMEKGYKSHRQFKNK